MNEFKSTFHAKLEKIEENLSKIHENINNKPRKEDQHRTLSLEHNLNNSQKLKEIKEWNEVNLTYHIDAGFKYQSIIRRKSRGRK